MATGVDGLGSGVTSSFMCGSFALLVTGVDGPGTGVLPEAVCFWPIVGIEWGLLNRPSKTALRPMNIAADMK